ncbi:MAG TPA: hypothetical protein VG754_03380 [Verrucomicrobiae bacterium]|nr:hypothetical protein [Verrucomicrobiae bacterium]
MHPEFNKILTAALGLLAGGVIGLTFGIIQTAAQRRNQRLQESGKLTSGWAVMPGSGKRVAYLLVALALVQFFCPLLFNNGSQWWVSGGVVAGYGWTLYKQLRERLAQNR